MLLCFYLHFWPKFLEYSDVMPMASDFLDLGHQIIANNRVIYGMAVIFFFSSNILPYGKLNLEKF